MQMEYDMRGRGQKVVYDMDGNEILEDEYGAEIDNVTNRSEMGGRRPTDKDEYGREADDT